MNRDKSLVQAVELWVPQGEVLAFGSGAYRGNVELTKGEFLDQLKGRTLDSNFTMGKGSLVGVDGEPEESQLVANAGREALLLMKVALGRR